MGWVDKSLFCLMIVLCFIWCTITDCEINALRKRVGTLEQKQSQTVEIKVQRVFDEDMRIYDYKLK